MDLAIQIVILTGGVLFSIGFTILIIVILLSLGRLKKFLIQVEKISAEVTDLVKEMKNLSLRVDTKLDHVDSVIDSTKTTVKMIGDVAAFVSKNILTNAAGIMTVLPAVKLGWKLIKNMKGEIKNV
jgi:hypothetical protein